MFVDTATFSLRDTQPSCCALEYALKTFDPDVVKSELVELPVCNS
jgi:hypothetical protein